MTEKKDDHHSRLLELFDNLGLKDIYERRVAYKPLYEYFQKLILEIGVRLCGLNQNSLRIAHLKTRWENIKYCLGYIEDPRVWEDLINKVNNIRQKVEHNDYYDPKQNELIEIRNKAPKFKEWIIRVAKEYYKKWKSKDFTFKEAFYHLSNRYIEEAEWILQEYGKNPPYAATSDYALDLEEYSYPQLSELTVVLKKRLKKVAKLEDIERSDLEILIQIVKIISHFKGKEEILLRYSICPKCGGKIKETQRYLGGTYDDPEPDRIYYRVGCEKCDYVLHSEIIDI